MRKNSTTFSDKPKKVEDFNTADNFDRIWTKVNRLTANVDSFKDDMDNIFKRAEILDKRYFKKDNLGIGLYTEGSVIFAGVDGVFSENNHGFYWNNAARRLTVGDTLGILNGFGMLNTIQANAQPTGDGLCGYYNLINKHGAGELHDFIGINSSINLELDNNAEAIDELIGIQNEAELTTGTVSEMYAVKNYADVNGGIISGSLIAAWNRAIQDGAAVGNNIYGTLNEVELLTGSVGANVYGEYTYLSEANTFGVIPGNAYGSYVGMDLDVAPTGTAYLQYLDEYTNIDYAIYHNGTAISRLGGNLQVNGGNIGIDADTNLLVMTANFLTVNGNVGLSMFSTDVNASALLYLNKSHSAVYGTYTSTLTNEYLGGVAFRGVDAGMVPSLSTAGYISMKQSGAAGTYVSGDVVFGTRINAETGVFLERAHVTPNGNFAALSSSLYATDETLYAAIGDNNSALAGLGSLSDGTDYYGRAIFSTVLKISPYTQTNTISISAKGDSYFNNSGSFGIGTITPSAKLEVNGGNVLITSAAATTDLNIDNTGGGVPDLVLKISGTPKGRIYLDPTSSHMRMSAYVAGVEYSVMHWNDISNYALARNFAQGFRAGEKLLVAGSTGIANLCLAAYAGRSLTTGNYLTLVGYSSGELLTTQEFDTGLGAQTFATATCKWSTAVGALVLNKYTGQGSVGVGEYVFNALVSGNYNTAGGYKSAYSLNGGAACTNWGTQSGYSNVSGSYQINLGFNCGYYETASNYLHIGSFGAVGLNQDRQKNIIVGLQNNTAASQVLWLHAKTMISLGETASSDPTQPAQLLEIEDNSATLTALQISNTSTGDTAIIHANNGTEKVRCARIDTDDRYQISMNGNTVNALAILQTGFVGINHTAPEGLLHSRSAAISNIFYMDCYDDTVTSSNYFYLRKSHNDTLGTKTQTIDTDVLGGVVFQGCDSGNNFDEGAIIYAIQNGASGSKSPTDLFLQTANATNGRANTIVLKADGKVGIGTTTPGYNLEVNGSIMGTDYYSGDGTQGATGTITLAAITTITVKDGLITAWA